MLTIGSHAAHLVVRNARRAKGVIQTRSVAVSGQGPEAVLAAISRSATGRFDADERQYIARIEALRNLLLLSPQEFDLVDHGSGPRDDPTDSRPAEDTSHVRTIGRMTLSSKPPMWARLLLAMVRELRPDSVLELGSCVGISAAYLSAGLQLNGSGRLISLEGVPALTDRSNRTLEELGLREIGEVRQGEFDETLGAAIADLAPVDLAFIDGNHREEPTLEYAARVLEHAGPEAILVFDDINYDDGMRRAWQAVVDDPRYALTVDLRSVGIAGVSASAVERHDLELGYY